MSKILVTGANGFVAVHIVSQLISRGHHVVGVFRTLSKGTQLLALHPSFTPSFEIAVVPDYAAPGAWDELFQTHDIEYVFHTAATIYEDPYETIEDFDKEYLEPTVKP